jgi:hypothetical protein
MSLAVPEESFSLRRTAGWASAGMLLLGGPVAVLLIAGRLLRGDREVREFAWPLALCCFTALPVAGLLIVGELLGLP